MKYERIEKAVFLERENRFVAYVELEGKREKVHVKNTGRCEELLIPGAEVYLQKSENEKRATLWDLIAVKKGERLVNLDSQVRGRMAANRQSVQRNPVYPSGDNLWRFKIRSLCRGGGAKSFYRSERGDTGRRRSLSVSGCTE